MRYTVEQPNIFYQHHHWFPLSSFAASAVIQTPQSGLWTLGKVMDTGESYGHWGKSENKQSMFNRSRGSTSTETLIKQGCDICFLPLMTPERARQGRRHRQRSHGGESLAPPTVTNSRPPTVTNSRPPTVVGGL